MASVSYIAFSSGCIHFLRAHRSQHYGDRVADVRPMLMHSLNTGQNVSGIELGRHGLGLRAVTPVNNAQGKVQAAVEVGGRFTTNISATN